MSNLNLICANLQSLMHHFSVLTFTETWTKHETENQCDIEGYNKYIKSQNQKEGVGSGVALYFKSDLEINVKIRSDLSSGDSEVMESLFVQVSSNRGSSEDIVIGVIYRPRQIVKYSVVSSQQY